MATASRSRQATGSKRPATTNVGLLMATDALRDYAVPGITVGVVAVAVALEKLEVVGIPGALAVAIAALLVLLLWIALRPLVAPGVSSQERLLAAGLAAVWLLACYLPFHARLFPGTPLVQDVQVTASGSGLPLRIPAAGHRAVDLLLEGKLGTNPTGGVAPPVHFRLTVSGASATQVVEGTFEDSLRTQRLGRRGTAVVHQTHTAEVRVLPNPGREDLSVTQLTLEPPNAQPITVSAFVHPLPGSLVLALAAFVLVAAVVAFDRLGPIAETDGAFTLTTLAVIGTVVAFWTGNAVHPDFSTLIGAAMLGGALGLGAGAVVWWLAKRLIAAPAR